MKIVRVPIQKMLDAASNGTKGLRCPKCGCIQFGLPGRGVRDTRHTRDGAIKRYRVCRNRNCGHVWCTFER